MESDILKKINNLRSQFLECLRKQRRILPSGSEGSNSKSAWWLYESMQFLLPYCCKDKGQSNIAVTYATTIAEVHREDERRQNNNNAQEDLVIELPDDIILEVDEHINKNSCNSDAESIDTNPQSVDSQVSQTPSGPTVTDIPQRKKRKCGKQSPNDADLDEFIKKAVDEIVSESKTAQNNPKSEIRAFCDFMESELSTIKNKVIYKRAKWNILNIIKYAQEEDDVE